MIERNFTSPATWGPQQQRARVWLPWIGGLVVLAGAPSVHAGEKFVRAETVKIGLWEAVPGEGRRTRSRLRVRVGGREPEKVVLPKGSVKGLKAPEEVLLMRHGGAAEPGTGVAGFFAKSTGNEAVHELALKQVSWALTPKERRLVIGVQGPFGAQAGTLVYALAQAYLLQTNQRLGHPPAVAIMESLAAPPPVLDDRGRLAATVHASEVVDQSGSVYTLQRVPDRIRLVPRRERRGAGEDQLESSTGAAGEASATDAASQIPEAPMAQDDAQVSVRMRQEGDETRFELVRTSARGVQSPLRSHPLSSIVEAMSAVEVEGEAFVLKVGHADVREPGKSSAKRELQAGRFGLKLSHWLAHTFDYDIDLVTFRTALVSQQHYVAAAWAGDL